MSWNESRHGASVESMRRQYVYSTVICVDIPIVLLIGEACRPVIHVVAAVVRRRFSGLPTSDLKAAPDWNKKNETRTTVDPGLNGDCTYAHGLH